jgi:membrane protease YdiL (CAAX protease family)
LGLLVSNVAVILVFGGVLAGGGYDDAEDLPMWLFALINAPLHLGLAVVSIWAVTEKGRGVVRDLHLRFNGWADAGTGVLTGVLAQLLLVPAVTLPIIWLTGQSTDDVSESARELADRATDPIGVIALTITTCLLAPVVEEIFFRGLVFGSYKKRINIPGLAMVWPASHRPDVTGRRWNLTIGVIASSAIFSAVHLSPLLFPALFAVGALFALLVQRYGRLGPAIWAHVGFNGTTILSLLAFDGDSTEAMAALVRALG